MNKTIKGVSLFSNVGIAETYLKDIGIEIVVANEIIEERANFYKHLYPETLMVCGDIENEDVRTRIIDESIKAGVNFVIATPPCQGMSRHGKRDPDDPRNYLIYYAIDVIKRLKPDFVLLENVPKILTTKIMIGGEKVLIPDYIRKELESDYLFAEDNIFNSDDYGVPQSRKRCIFRLVRKKLNIFWPAPTKKKTITLEDAIGDLPSLDPFVREKEYRGYFPDFEAKKEEGLKISKWHYPPTHGWKHVLWMMHTPSGKSAKENKYYYPEKDGRPIDCRLSCYRRYSWKRPANTVTQNNGVISSACCVHPGRYIGKDELGFALYSDARVLTIYELLIISSLPADWNIPEWADERLIRNVIGEGIPPLLVKAIVEELVKVLKD